jgi:hypothetical protein
MEVEVQQEYQRYCFQSSSKRPYLATITLESKSGTDVPAAKKVKPMRKLGIPTVVPIVSAQPTMKYEQIPIQMMESRNAR